MFASLVILIGISIVSLMLGALRAPVAEVNTFALVVGLSAGIVVPPLPVGRQPVPPPPRPVSLPLAG